MKTKTSSTQRFASSIGVKRNLQYLGNGIYVAMVKVSPLLASKWISLNFDKNRKRKARTILKYANDLRNNRWKLTHNGIAFNENKQLVDGQHRLLAIILSKQPLETLVFFGIPADSVQAFDQNIPRSAKDAADIAGLEVPKRHLETAKAAYNGLNDISHPTSNEKALELISSKPYKDGLAWLDENLSGVRGVSTAATVRGAILRAYLFLQESNDLKAITRLMKFCEVFASGQYNNIKQDRVAWQLREKFLKTKLFGQRRVIFGITETAIFNFLTCKMSGSIKVPENELFPLEVTPSLENEVPLEESMTIKEILQMA